MRSSENTTSSATKSSPLWNFTPFRKWKRHLSVRQNLPPLSQARDDLQILVALGEPLHHVAHGAERERLVQRVGIERIEIALECVTKGLRRRRGRGERKRQRGGNTQSTKPHRLFSSEIPDGAAATLPLAVLPAQGRDIGLSASAGPATAPTNDAAACLTFAPHFVACAKSDLVLGNRLRPGLLGLGRALVHAARAANRSGYREGEGVDHRLGQYGGAGLHPGHGAWSRGAGDRL